MSKHRSKSQHIVDLLMVEQELFAGGQSNFRDFGKVPKILGNSFPNITGFNPFGSTGNRNTKDKIQAYNNNVGTVLY